MMRRRTFITTLAGSLLAAPLGALAQLAGKMYRIGFFNVGVLRIAADGLLTVEIRDAARAVPTDERGRPSALALTPVRQLNLKTAKALGLTIAAAGGSGDRVGDVLPQHRGPAWTEGEVSLPEEPP